MADRRKACKGIIRKLFVQRLGTGMRDWARQVQRVTISRRRGDICCCDGGAGTGPVFDNDRLLEVFAQLNSEDACAYIRRATRRKRNNNADRFGREGLC